MPILPDRLKDLVDFDAATLRVSSREGKHREFKQQFSSADFSRFTKALAAFCNTEVFGINDKTFVAKTVDTSTMPT
jgi:predicted lipoprotein